MLKLFELVTDDDIAYCIKIWALSVGKADLTPDFSDTQNISKLKVVIVQSSEFEQIQFEARLAVENDDFSLNSTLINEVFNFLDSQLLH